MRASSRHKRCRKAVQENNVDDLTQFERVCEHLREIQWKTNCSTMTLQVLLDALHGKLGALVKSCDELPRKVTQADKKMESMVIIRNYYVASNKFAYLYFTYVFYMAPVRRTERVLAWLRGSRLRHSLGTARSRRRMPKVWRQAI